MIFQRLLTGRSNSVEWKIIMGDRMKWALLIIITLLTILSLSLPVVGYCLTGSWLTLMPAVTSIPLSFVWKRITESVFPIETEKTRKISNK